MPMKTRSQSAKHARRKISGRDEHRPPPHHDKNFIQCDAFTNNGKRCLKEAHFQLDLKKDRIMSVFGYSVTIPISKLGLKCCHYCKVHAIEYGGLQIGNGINYIVANGLVADAELWVAQNAADPNKPLDVHKITGLHEK